MTKNADDTSLLVPEINTVSLEDEFDHLQVWVQRNKLVINLLKTRDIVFHGHNPRSNNADTFDQHWTCSVRQAVGVYIMDNLGAGKQIDFAG